MTGERLLCTCSPGKVYLKAAETTGITKEMALNNPELAESLGVMHDLRGKSWNCELCASIKRTNIKKDLKNGIMAYWEDGTLVYTFTLTSPLTMSLQTFRDSLHRWVTSMKIWLHRRGHREIEYNWEKEYGEENGMRHVHGFLAIKPSDIKRLQKGEVSERVNELWKEATDGKAILTNCKRLLKRHGFKRMYYAIKYIAKQEQQKHFTRHERRFFFSHGWPRLPKKDKTHDWEAIIYPRGAEMLMYEIRNIAPEIRQKWLEKSRRKAKVKERITAYGDRFKDSYCYRLDDYT